MASFDRGNRAAEAQARTLRMRVAAGAALDRHRAGEAGDRSFLVVARRPIARDRAAVRVDVDFGGDAASRDDLQMNARSCLCTVPDASALLVEREAVFAVRCRLRSR